MRDLADYTLDLMDSWQEKAIELGRENDAYQAARIAYASEFPPDADGQPDVGSIHGNIRKLKAENERLTKQLEGQIRSNLAILNRVPNEDDLRVVLALALQATPIGPFDSASWNRVRATLEDES